MNTKKVTITARVVYHKLASVTIDVPPHITEDNLQDWLWENEELLFVDTLDNALNEAKYEHGFGLDQDNGMDEKDSDYEVRFDLIQNNQTTFGGHL